MGWGWDDFVDTVSDVGNAFGNYVTQVYTLGTVSYGEEGFNVGDGFAIRAIDEFGGNNDKREDEYSQRVVQEQKDAQQSLIDKQTEQARLQDVRASSSARAIRNTGRAQASSAQGLGGLGTSDEKDFLGL